MTGSFLGGVDAVLVGCWSTPVGVLVGCLGVAGAGGTGAFVDATGSACRLVLSWAGGGAWRRGVEAGVGALVLGDPGADWLVTAALR